MRVPWRRVALRALEAQVGRISRNENSTACQYVIQVPTSKVRGLIHRRPLHCILSKPHSPPAISGDRGIRRRDRKREIERKIDR